MVLVFAVLLTMCSREIVRLQAENRALKKQHAELEQERDRLAKELSTVGDKEYIKEQARKQLKLLDPGEIMFVFEDGSAKKDKADNEDTAAEEESEDTETEEGADE
jgi:cell division protein FtsB